MRIRKTLLGTTLVCLVFSLILVTLPTTSGFAESTNSEPSPPFSLPPTKGSNSTSYATSPDTGKNLTYGVWPFNTTIAPTRTPRVLYNPDGSYYYDFGGALDSDYWWSEVDFWTSFGYGLPSKMNGTFTAVENTIGGLDSQKNDVVMYLPLNVVYGDLINWVWFQFQVEFSNTGVIMRIWDNHGGVYNSTDIPMDYVPGETYRFELTPSGTNTLTFSIYGQWSYWSKNTWHWPIGSTDMISSSYYWSPASAVEGYTSNGQLTDVPFLVTHVGYETPAHSHSSCGSGEPSGIGTKVWYDGDYYYWAMLSNTYMSSAAGFQYPDDDYGYVEYPGNLVGSSPDSNLAIIYEEYTPGTGYIFGEMNTASGGEVYVYGKSVSGYASDLLVFASANDEDWFQIGQTVTVYNWNSPDWIYIGKYLSSFKYIAVVGYRTDNQVALLLDAVHVGNSI